MSVEHLALPMTTWLESSTAGDNTTAVLTCNQPWPYWCLPCHQSVIVTSTERRIRLSLGEMEHLRMHAAGNPKLKAILQKFTDHIEIVVEFE